ncbi:hypothetical protein Ae201684P_021422 [Aphanomyces euteiches]|uniref:Elicitin-like protein n=1 Tax=Aphanomyces euteiches TaxID=100861 RepID=A0A6G0X778_9STRA|nr:hypothetical protein Ae201684_007759 [Aphanomyces euteiches]KAH9067260.1 hypothetical protein Ae201684P_021422 [Aphanomyces euteiches]KAH9146758.1 hypothetical protein AeRB84_009404 [Aphanomyces euteiches]
MMHALVVAAALMASPALAIDGRLPCDRSVLLELSGKDLWQVCMKKSGLGVETVNKANAAIVCSVPECALIVQKIPVMSKCPNVDEFVGICNSTNTTVPNPTTTSATTASPTPPPSPTNATSDSLTGTTISPSTTTAAQVATPAPTQAKSFAPTIALSALAILVAAFL